MCKLSSLPEGMHHLPSLRELNIFGCPNLESLPKEMCNLSSHICLSLARCDKLESLPQGMHCFTSLKELIITECPLLPRRIMDGHHTKIANIQNVYIDGNLIDTAPCHKFYPASIAGSVFIIQTPVLITKFATCN